MATEMNRDELNKILAKHKALARAMGAIEAEAVKAGLVLVREAA